LVTGSGNLKKEHDILTLYNFIITWILYLSEYWRHVSLKEQIQILGAACSSQDDDDDDNNNNNNIY
jgi:hypothetical protein